MRRFLPGLLAAIVLAAPILAQERFVTNRHGSDDINQIDTATAMLNVIRALVRVHTNPEAPPNEAFVQGVLDIPFGDAVAFINVARSELERFDFDKKGLRQAACTGGITNAQAYVNAANALDNQIAAAQTSTYNRILAQSPESVRDGLRAKETEARRNTVIIELDYEAMIASRGLEALVENDCGGQ